MKNCTSFRRSLRSVATALTLGAAVLTAPGSHAYPLDVEDSGIRRLQGFKPETAAKGGIRQPVGALLTSQDIHLNLHSSAGDNWDFSHSAKSPQLQQALETMFKERHPSYGVVVVDITQPDNIVWGGVRENHSQVPGSVGKIITMLGFFSELARAFPEIEARQQLLREHTVIASEWVNWDEHKVPRYDPETNSISKAIIEPGDQFVLAEWLDNMIASSANSAAATLWKETVLLRHFGSDYPPSLEQEAQFFRETPRKKLWELASQAISEPMLAAGLDSNVFWIGNLWTRTAKTLIPGNGNSRGTALEMARYLLRLEQGKLVDQWSSLEMKKYLYTTSRRYRYVYPEELRRAAVYFKSGSFYKCRAEVGFSCAKYAGNVDNLMNSIAIVETPAEAGAEQKRYIVALISNVLRKNSAWDHARLGAAVEALIQTRAAAAIIEDGSAEAIRGAGGQD